MELHINTNSKKGASRVPDDEAACKQTDFLCVSPKSNDESQFIAAVIAIILRRRKTAREGS